MGHVHYGRCLCGKRGETQTHTGKPVRRQGERMITYEPGRAASEEISPAVPLVSD